MNGPRHDPLARECIVVGAPLFLLHDRPCPACRELSALIDLDPDFGSAEDGRPNLREGRPSCPEAAAGIGDCDGTRDGGAR